MLDIGWSEFLVVGVVALVVIGPRELPVALRTAGRYVARARALANEFRDGLDDIARETELKDIEKKIGGDISDDWINESEARDPEHALIDKTDDDTGEAEADEALEEIDEIAEADLIEEAEPIKVIPEPDLEQTAETAAAEEADRVFQTAKKPDGQGSGA